jgi:hypothetical protein
MLDKGVVLVLLARHRSLEYTSMSTYGIHHMISCSPGSGYNLINFRVVEDKELASISPTSRSTRPSLLLSNPFCN